jgi:hypothetical protein
MRVVPTEGTIMQTRILTDYERKYVIRYLQKDGERVIQVRKVVSGAKKHLRQIKEDLALLERLVEVYSRNNNR